MKASLIEHAHTASHAETRPSRNTPPRTSFSPVRHRETVRRDATPHTHSHMAIGPCTDGRSLRHAMPFAHIGGRVMFWAPRPPTLRSPCPRVSWGLLWLLKRRAVRCRPSWRANGWCGRARRRPARLDGARAGPLHPVPAGATARGAAGASPSASAWARARHCGGSQAWR